MSSVTASTPSSAARDRATSGASLARSPSRSQRSSSTSSAIRFSGTITEPGVHGVDLLFLSPDEAVLALEVKGTLRAGAVPCLTPSHLRQMSRDWLNQPDNPAMSEWELEADDLCAGVMVVDLTTPTYRI